MYTQSVPVLATSCSHTCTSQRFAVTVRGVQIRGIRLDTEVVAQHKTVCTVDMLQLQVTPRSDDQKSFMEGPSADLRMCVMYGVQLGLELDSLAGLVGQLSLEVEGLLLSRRQLAACAALAPLQGLHTLPTTQMLHICMNQST